jgi:hypothetical protein
MSDKNNIEQNSEYRSVKRWLIFTAITIFIFVPLTAIARFLIVAIEYRSDFGSQLYPLIIEDGLLCLIVVIAAIYAGYSILYEKPYLKNKLVISEIIYLLYTGTGLISWVFQKEAFTFLIPLCALASIYISTLNLSIYYLATCKSLGLIMKKHVIWHVK